MPRLSLLNGLLTISEDVSSNYYEICYVQVYVGRNAVRATYKSNEEA